MALDLDRVLNGGGAVSDHQFLTTRWSLVVSARDQHTEASREALESLCKIYWQPLYVYVRRQGHAPEEAEDLTQGFFARLLRQDAFLQSVHPDKGRFRSFLLGCMKHYLLDEHKHRTRMKRGGGQQLLSLDRDLAEREMGETAPSSTEMSPEVIFDRGWAKALLAEAMRRLKDEFKAPDKKERFEALKPFLTGTVPDSLDDVCDRLGFSRNNLHVHIHRLRDRYRALIRQSIADTVANPTEVDDEMRYLFEVLSVHGAEPSGESE